MTDDVVERVRQALAASRAEVFSAEETLDGLRALRPGDELPGGMVVAPKEATEMMIAAVEDLTCQPRRFWELMLSAAKEEKDE